SLLFFSTPPPPPATYTLSLHDALPIFASTDINGYGVLGSIAGEGFTHRASNWGTDVDSSAASSNSLPSKLSPGFNPDYALEINQDRKSTRLNSSHVSISYAVFCLKKKI